MDQIKIIFEIKKIVFSDNLSRNMFITHQFKPPFLSQLFDFLANLRYVIAIIHNYDLLENMLRHRGSVIPATGLKTIGIHTIQPNCTHDASRHFDCEIESVKHTSAQDA